MPLTTTRGSLIALAFLLLGPRIGEGQILTPPLNDTDINHSSACTSNPCGADRYGEPDSVFSVSTREDCLRRGNALLRFDLSGMPAGSEIGSATLWLYAVYQNEYATNDFHVNRLLEGWDTNTVNWCLRESGIPWSTAGGAYTALGQATITIPSLYGENPPLNGAKHPYNAWFSWDVTAIVQAWADGAPNHGFIVRQTPVGGSGRNQALSFASKEHPLGAGVTARLLIDPAVPVVPTTWSQVKRLTLYRD